MKLYWEFQEERAFHNVKIFNIYFELFYFKCKDLKFINQSLNDNKSKQ